jgi:hypothetical protein
MCLNYPADELTIENVRRAGHAKPGVYLRIYVRYKKDK